MYALRTIAATALLIALLTGCASLPAPPASHALPADGTALHDTLRTAARQHPRGTSGLRLLGDSNESFAARAELAREAQRSLDLQYYIVQDGLSTRLLIKELLSAADRGVRVRLLLDDTSADGYDRQIGVLATHPNIQVRLFNPLHLGRANGATRLMGRALNLSRQHRRMHNKLWLADSQVAVVGGRNLGDEYFDAEPGQNFTDMDLMAAGPVAGQLARSFDEYWNSHLSRPIDDFLWSRPGHAELADMRRRLDQALQEARDSDRDRYRRLMAFEEHPQLERWLDRLIWAPAEAMWDTPAKILSQGEPDPRLLLATQLLPEMREANRELVLISAYFVPGETGVSYLLNRADQGVAVRLLTNSLAATDVPIVHGGYAPYRPTLLDHGIQLYELRRQPEQSGRFSLSGGSSESALHTKAAILDGEKVFIGSFNFDPRSALWNTEVGVLVHSPELSRQALALAQEGMSPALSYRLELRHEADGERIVWWTEEDGKPLALSREPGGFWRHFAAWLSERVGLERLL